jgi:hypothetical protein
MLLALCLLPGCLDVGRLTGPAPTATQPVTPAEATTAPPSLVPGPTQTLPPDYYVAFDVQKQGQAGIPTITVIFRGGTGQIFTTQATVKVTRADGSVVTKSMDHPKVGEEVNIEGTPGEDHVEIIVLVSTGNSYKVYDQLLPYQSVN